MEDKIFLDHAYALYQGLSVRKPQQDVVNACYYFITKHGFDINELNESIREEVEILLYEDKLGEPYDELM